MAAVKAELEYGEEKGNFDKIIVNDDLQNAYKSLKDFILPDIRPLMDNRPIPLVLCGPSGEHIFIKPLANIATCQACDVLSVDGEGESIEIWLGFQFGCEFPRLFDCDVRQCMSKGGARNTNDSIKPT